MRNLSRSREGFTLTELSVLMGVGVILASVVAADLNEARTKLLQQACAANMKQWGMAFSMYADDYNGTFYYDANGIHYDDGGALPSPLCLYLGTSSDATTMVRNMRICPSRIGQVSVFVRGYQMPIGQYRKGLTYAAADSSGSPFWRGVPSSYWPDLKSVPQPAQYLLLIECGGNTLHCGGLVTAVSQPAAGSIVDPLPAGARHGGAVNCLFGDFHVELISTNKIVQQNGVNCGGTTGNVWFNLN